MESTSPYAPPQREVLDEQDEYGPIRIFSLKGRIGRLRYIGYTIGLTLLLYLILGALFAALSTAVDKETRDTFLALIPLLGFFFMLVVHVMLTVQRCHDFNVTGWLSLLLLFPFVPLVFWIIPGTQGSNDFGLRPPPNRGMAVVVVLLILLTVIGVLAAIAIPAYQGYAARAHQIGM
jgi:uncharacterized membrane protein YhaH (DUF805 family)